MKSGRVVVLCPMDCESELLLSQMTEKREKCVGGYRVYEGNIGNTPVAVIRCLMGSVNAAVSTAYAIGQYDPRCVILQGTAGAHDPAYRIGDIVIAEKIVSLTNVITPPRKSGEGTDPFAWESFGVQSYSKKEDSTGFADAFFCDGALVAEAKKVPYQNGRVAVGTVGCGDVWNREADLIAHYHKTKGTDCEAMEGIGVAQTCAAFDVPMLEIRVISNNELHENEPFTEDAAKSCQCFVLAFIEKMTST